MWYSSAIAGFRDAEFRKAFKEPEYPTRGARLTEPATMLRPSARSRSGLFRGNLGFSEPSSLTTRQSGVIRALAEAASSSAASDAMRTIMPVVTGQVTSAEYFAATFVAGVVLDDYRVHCIARRRRPFGGSAGNPASRNGARGICCQGAIPSQSSVSEPQR
jgi:hypothetical protein